VNQRLCEMLGYSEPELLARTYVDVTHPEDLSLDFVHMSRLLSGGQRSGRYEKRDIHKNGSIVWGELTISSVLDERGQMKYVVGVLVDITERKRIEEALGRNEFYLAEAQRLGRTGSWAWNVASREFIHWSQEHYRLHGLDPHQGTPSWDAAQ